MSFTTKITKKQHWIFIFLLTYITIFIIWWSFLLIDKNKRYYALLENAQTIVESEKTAIISNIYLPEFIWLASGSLLNLNYEKCKVLKGRNVILFPDLNGFEIWTKKAKEFSSIGNFQVSNLLELKGNEIEKKQGWDLADYLLKFGFNEFNNGLVKPDQPIKSENAGPVCFESKNSNSEIKPFPEIEFESGYPAFIDNSGKLFIETPLGKTYTVYSSINHYNQRYCYPIFQDRNQIDKTILKAVWINSHSLTFNN